MNSASALLRLYISLIEQKWFSVNANQVFCVKKFIKSGLEMLFKRNLHELGSGLFHLKNSLHEQFKADLRGLLGLQLKMVSNEKQLMIMSIMDRGDAFSFYQNNESYNQYMLGIFFIFEDFKI